jgi:hypothetical protein
MIALAAVAAFAAPVVSEWETGPSALDRCAMEAEAQAGVASGSWRTSPPDTLPASERVAVVVGVPCHRDPSIPSLAYSTRDAERIAQTLESGGFTVVRLLTVVDRATLTSALDDAVRAVTPDGTLLVYFSGHGVLRDLAGTLQRYLVLSDTELGAIAETGVSVLDLDHRVRGVNAESRIVIQDTCFASDLSTHAESSNGKSLGIAGTPRAGELKGLSTPEGNLALDSGDLRLYASKFFEQAIESPEYRSSIYTHNLLAAFGSTEADLDGDGCVGLIEAHEWAAVATYEERSSFQTPQIRADTAPNLVLGCRADRPRRAVVMPPPDSLLVTMQDADGNSAAIGGGPVSPGRYTVDIDRVTTGSLGELVTQDLGRLRMQLDAGEWLDVNSEVRRRRRSAAWRRSTGGRPRSATCTPRPRSGCRCGACRAISARGGRCSGSAPRGRRVRANRRSKEGVSRRGRRSASSGGSGRSASPTPTSTSRSARSWRSAAAIAPSTAETTSSRGCSIPRCACTWPDATCSCRSRRARARSAAASP